MKIETVRHAFNYASQLIRVMIKKWTPIAALSGLKFSLLDVLFLVILITALDLFMKAITSKLQRVLIKALVDFSNEF